MKNFSWVSTRHALNVIDLNHLQHHCARYCCSVYPGDVGNWKIDVCLRRKWVCCQIHVRRTTLVTFRTNIRLLFSSQPFAELASLGYTLKKVDCVVRTSLYFQQLHIKSQNSPLLLWKGKQIVKTNSPEPEDQIPGINLPVQLSLSLCKNK